MFFTVDFDGTYAPLHRTDALFLKFKVTTGRHATNMNTEPEPKLHPYYPLGAEIRGGYSPNTYPSIGLIVAFGSIIVAIWAAVVAIARKINPRIGRGDVLTLCWFTLCKCTLDVVVPPSHHPFFPNRTLQPDSGYHH